MTTRNVATVFGGSGFLGRYIVKRLAASGHIVRVAVRDPEAALFLKPMGGVGQIVPLFCSLTNPATVASAVDGAAIVVNCVGILAERRPGDFQRLQADGPGHIAKAATAAGVTHVVHISAIGADPLSPSAYGKTKAKGEVAMLGGFPAATVLRPSIVFGPEDGFFNRFGAMAQNAPIMPVICGDTKFQPVYVGDVADAVMAALRLPAARGTIYELGGPTVWTFRRLLTWILDETGRRRRMIEIPPKYAAMQARFMERLPGKPFTMDQLLMLERDNVVSGDKPGLAELGVQATPLELIVPQYLQRFRKGGGRRETFAASMGPNRA